MNQLFISINKCCNCDVLSGIYKNKNNLIFLLATPKHYHCLLSCARQDKPVVTNNPVISYLSNRLHLGLIGN